MGDLSSAAGKGDISKVKQLLARGAKPDGRDCDREEMEDGLPMWRPLSQAAIKGHLEIMQLLLDKGVSVDEVNSSGESALLLSAFFAQAKSIELLLAHGADIHQTNDRGNALQNLRLDDEHLARSATVAKLLLAKGCSPTDKNGHAQSAIDIWTDLRSEGPLPKGVAKPMLAILEAALPHAGKRAYAVKKAIALCEKALGSTAKPGKKPATAKKPAAKKAPAKGTPANKTRR